MKKTLFVALLGFGLPMTSFAATYLYVNTSGAIQTVTADNPNQALALAQNIDPHSGVMLQSGTIDSSGTLSMYEYVNVNGTLSVVRANNPSQALALATDIAPHSGVMIVRNA